MLDYLLEHPIKLFVLIISIIIVGGISASVFQAKMESDTYNRLTGAQTTWWDALWVELRVQGQPK